MFFILLCFLLISSVFAIPTNVVIQGTLSDTSGPLPGNRAWRVQYYDAQAGGNPLGTAISGTLAVSDSGLWSISLTPPVEALNATGEVWYEIAIDSSNTPDGSIDPGDVFPERVKVQSVLFAQYAIKADTATTATTAGDALQLGGLPANDWSTDSELAAGIAGKADASHSHNLHDLTGYWIQLDDLATTPSITENRLYQIGNRLYFQDRELALWPDDGGTYPNHVTFKSATIGPGGTDVVLTIDGGATHIQDTFGPPDDTTDRLYNNNGHLYWNGTQLDRDNKEVLDLSAAHYIFTDIKSCTTDAERGTALVNAYNTAKTLSPSDSNRIAVIVLPSHYDVGSSGLVMDTGYIDLIGLTTNYKGQHIYGTPSTGGGVITQTADNVSLINLCIQVKTNTPSNPGGSVTDWPVAWLPDVSWNDGTSHTGSSPGTLIRNCEFKIPDGLEGYPSVASEYPSMRIGSGIEYAGVYENCIAGGKYAFGGYEGAAVGEFTECTAGDFAFGGYKGVASGRFVECTGGAGAFAGGDSSDNSAGETGGTFILCTGGDYSFAGGDGGYASGNFHECTGGDYSFAGDAETIGHFTQCTGGDYSFGGKYVANGFFTKCTGGIGSFGGEGIAMGEFRHCEGGARSFGGASGPDSPGAAATALFFNCTGGDYSFGDCISNDTEFIHCKAGDYSFGIYTAGGIYSHCSGGQYSFASFQEGTTPREADGEFNSCSAGDFSFALNGLASGVFRNCIGGESCFGAQEGDVATTGTASGTFLNCTASRYSFGGKGGIASGVFQNCNAGDYSFGGHFDYAPSSYHVGKASGDFTRCHGGDYSFGGGGGLAGGTFRECTGKDYSFGGHISHSGSSIGTASGQFIRCIAGDGSFGGNGGTATGGRFHFCDGDGPNAWAGDETSRLYCIKNGSAY